MIVKTHNETDVEFRGKAASRYLLAANVDTHSWNSVSRLILFYFFLYQADLCNVLILDTKKAQKNLTSVPQNVLANSFPTLVATLALNNCVASSS